MLLKLFCPLIIVTVLHSCMSVPFWQPIKPRAGSGPKADWTKPIRHRDYEIPEDKIISLPVGRFPEPNCEYSVLKDSLNGPKATQAGRINIGDRLFHRWRCHPVNTAPNLYCISVSSCKVTSGYAAAPLIDENGCSVEPQIIPHVTYSKYNQLDAWIEVNAFRLINSEETLLNFHCQINILIKENNRCPRFNCPEL